MQPPSDNDIAQYFDGMVDCCAPRRDPAKRPQVGLAKVLLDQLIAAGIAGKSVLDVGCGRGELSAEILRAGASRVTGTDLSAPSIELARRMANDEKLADHLTFQVGNGAADAQPHDVVVHHRVICCYPKAHAFLDETVRKATSVYAFSMPRSQGPLGLGVRGVLAMENVVHRIKRRGFRVYAHDERDVDAALRSAGFRLHGRKNDFAWFAAAYVR